MAYFKKDTLYKDVEKYIYTFAKTCCQEASYELTQYAKYAIEEFYADYDPKYYDRTFDLRDNSILPYYHNNGRIIYGGVRISSENMSPYQPFSKNPTDPFEVASFAWNGWHGHPLRGIYMYPTPLDIVREKMKSKVFIDKITKKAEKAAKSQNYSILQF